MTYDEALEYIHGISWTFCKPGLDRIGELCDRLGHPERGLKFIHVAGTNGKGSTSSMLSSVLTAAGYRVGLYTSPYIYRFNERMAVSGEPISDARLADITSRVRPIADAMDDKPTEFELITAIAFEYFKDEACDVVVLEAGMGGRLDSTNIIRHPLLSVITGIALDHTAILGDTVEKIAAEKAGIIKDRAPVLYGGDCESAALVISATATERGSALYRPDYSSLHIEETTLSATRFSYRDAQDYKIRLLGEYQPRNACVVIDAVRILRERGLNISDSALREGLWMSEWRGRFEIIDRDPLVIFDGAHNPQGIDAAVASIKQYFNDEGVVIFTGVLRDKDYKYIASRLATVASSAVTITPNNPRALSAEEYAEVLRTFGVDATPCDSVVSALTQGREMARNEGRALCCLGSLYTYVDVINSLNEIKEK